MTTILSITLLIFTVLANQYGAHVLRVFKIRTFTKFVIGWFSAVYMYMLYNVYTMTLNSAKVPRISITVGALFTVSTIFLLILYIHFLVRQIQIGTVVYEIFIDLKKTINSMKPLEIENPRKELEVEFNFKSDLIIPAANAGYLQAVDKENLKDLANEKGVSIFVPVRTGHFVVSGEVLAYLESRHELDDSVLERAGLCFLSGKKRIPVDDLECNLDTLVEMTLRALSPGINDLIVANNCINYIGETIALLVNKQFQDARHYSDEGNLLLACKEFTFEGYVNAAFNPIRQYAVEHCIVAIRMLDLLIKVTRINRYPPYQDVINRHFKAIYEPALAHHRQDLDQESIKSRYEDFNDCLTNEKLTGVYASGIGE